MKDGFSPVVFCRYVATAHYVKEHLQSRLKDAQLEVVTGEFPTEERVRRVEAMGDKGSRVLVATDCLSEGVNLQAYFDAVIHYDLSWNPTRHEQREGRVDRYGQPKEVVRASLIYGAEQPGRRRGAERDPAQGEADSPRNWACRCRSRTRGTPSQRRLCAQ